MLGFGVELYFNYWDVRMRLICKVGTFTDSAASKLSTLLS